LMKRFKSVSNVINASVQDLTAVDGVDSQIILSDIF
jgi:excinuclease UvrABC nuclease subunit